MPTPDPKRPSSDSGMGSWYSMAGAGVEFVVAVLMFAGIGWLLDRWLATAPWLLIAGVAVGFGTGLYILLRMAQRTFRD